MSKRIRSHLYMVYKFKGLKVVKDDDNYLYSQGRYKTKITAEDLPKWFVYGYFYGQYGYIDSKNIVDLYYKPNYTFENEFLKYDSLYISYNKPITVKEDSDNWNCCENYDEVINGKIILDFISAAKAYSNFDVENIIDGIIKKLEFFGEKNPSCDYDRSDILYIIDRDSDLL